MQSSAPEKQISPQKKQQLQQQLTTEAAKRGLSLQQYVDQLKAQALRQHEMAQEQKSEDGGKTQAPVNKKRHQQFEQQVPISAGPPKPEAIALAKFLQSQDLKTRVCILQEKRKVIFKVKRAIRALLSPNYVTARLKNPLLPPIPDRTAAEKVFKLLPISLMALRVSKIEPRRNSQSGNTKMKRIKGLWTVKIEQQQEVQDHFHYVWLYEGSQWKQRIYAATALAIVIAIVMFPLWPFRMRQAVWYLSMGLLGMVAFFFAMSLARLILFGVTIFILPPGLWLYPNLFEDVGFFDSFRPLWGWHETFEEIKAKRKEERSMKAAKRAMRSNQTVSGKQPGTNVPSITGAEFSSGTNKD